MLITLYNVYETWEAKERPTLFKVEVVRSKNGGQYNVNPLGPSAGLAFGCRRRFRPGEFPESPAEAWKEYADQQMRAIDFAAQESAKATRNLGIAQREHAKLTRGRST